MDETPTTKLQAHTSGHADDASTGEESSRPTSADAEVSALSFVSGRESLSLEEASKRMLDELAHEYRIHHALLVFHLGGTYIKTASTGLLTTSTAQLDIDRRDARLIRAARDKRWVALSTFDKNFEATLTTLPSDITATDAPVSQATEESRTFRQAQKRRKQ
jgi:hypothetical protein